MCHSFLRWLHMLPNGRRTSPENSARRRVECQYWQIKRCYQSRSSITLGCIVIRRCCKAVLLSDIDQHTRYFIDHRVLNGICYARHFEAVCGVFMGRYVKLTHRFLAVLCLANYLALPPPFLPLSTFYIYTGFSPFSWSPTESNLSLLTDLHSNLDVTWPSYIVLSMSWLGPLHLAILHIPKQLHVTLSSFNSIFAKCHFHTLPT